MKCHGSSPKRHDTFFVDVLNYDDLEGGLNSDRPPHCEWAWAINAVIVIRVSSSINLQFFNRLQPLWDQFLVQSLTSTFIDLQ